MNLMKISQLIKKLQKIQDKHGDLIVYYQSDYDWGLQIRAVSVAEETGHEGVPEHGKWCAIN